MLDTTDQTYNAPYLQEDDNEPFQSNNLTECLNYHAQTKDREPLENAVMNAKTVIEKQIAEIQFLIDYERTIGKRSHIANKLIRIRIELEGISA